MNILLHDLPPDAAQSFLSRLDGDWMAVDANQPAARCVGCFNCWLKTPGLCRFADSLQTLGQRIMSSQRFIIVSQMLYGGFSVPVKRVIDRFIPGTTPFFQIRSGRLHHFPRYENRTEITAIFYNTLSASAEEKEHGAAYINAMGINFNSSKQEAIFVDRPDLSEVCL